MRRAFTTITGLFFCLCLFSQTVDDVIQRMQEIRQESGDSIARDYLEQNRSIFVSENSSSSYVVFWGVLTSNMWNANPSESLKTEYKHYLDNVFDDEIRSENFMPDLESLPTLWQLTLDYYMMLYKDGNKEEALQLLYLIHRWFGPYTDARNSIGYAQSLLDLCLILVRDMHKYKEGEPFCREYINVSKNVYGDQSSQYAIALYNITVLPQGNFEEKIGLLKDAITIYEHAENNDQAMLAQMRQSYEMLVSMQTGVSNTTEISENETNLTIEECTRLLVSGRSEEVLPSLQKHKKLLWNEEYVDTLKYASIVNLLTNAYIGIGDYASAQKEIEDFNNNIGISIDKLPVEYVQIFFLNAGLIAYQLKDYPKALRFSQAACKLFEKTGNFGIEYSKVLGNIAIIYAEAAENLGSEYYLDAKWYIDEAISVFEERVGPLKEHGNIGITLLSNKALVYDAIGDRDNAILALEEIVNDYSDNIDVRDAWQFAVNNLAVMYMKEGRWADGEKILAPLNSNDSGRKYMFAQNLALCYMYMKNTCKAVETLEEMNRYAIDNIAKIFSYFAGIERNDYWTQISKELILNNNLVAYHTNDGQAISTAYNNALFCKNLLLNSSRIIENYSLKSSNAYLQLQIHSYKELKNQLAYKTTSVAVRDSLSREITKCEKSILESIGDYGQLLKNELQTWEEVKNSLADGEIAIEYCYAPRMEHFPDLQPFYGAFVLRKDMQYPMLVSLENVDDTEDVFYNDNQDGLFINELYNSEKAQTLYKMLWSKLSPYLKDIHTVYYSPTGPLATLNFDILCDENGKMLNEKYAMRRVSSTANIQEMKQSEKMSLHTSVLYGNINYEETTAEMAEASKLYNSFTGDVITNELSMRSEDERGRWGSLPATKSEIDAIGKILSQNNVDTLLYEKNAANEESFKSLSGKSPDILHLATHGFVIDTQQKAEGNKFVASTNVYSQKESYMMWAGLLMAGANNVWQGKFSLENVEDGVLTADEISRLDLSNTKLAVLSACETARGKVDPVDGVYGLQRALKMAGVQTIVMSLWKVQDKATSMLMTQFYTYLTKGVERHQALWKAMMDVREKYPDPYYWAGFVMLD
jgi:CHAT domain-containing protein